MRTNQEIEASNLDAAQLSMNVVWSGYACQFQPVIEVLDDGLRLSITVYRGAVADGCGSAEFFRGVRLTLSEPRDAGAVHLTVFDPPEPPASFDRD